MVIWQMNLLPIRVIHQSNLPRMWSINLIEPNRQTGVVHNADTSNKKCLVNFIWKKRMGNIEFNDSNL